MLRVGIVANEFFDARLGDFGGFGVAARLAGETLSADPDWEPVYVMGKPTAPELGMSLEINSIPVLLRPRNESRWLYAKRLASARLDALLCIDYRPSYTTILQSLPWVASVIWVHDPRTSDDVNRVSSLRLPDGGRPGGVTPINCNGLSRLVRRPLLVRGKYLFGLNAHYLEHKMTGTYGFRAGRATFLPTPVFSSLPESKASSSKRPSVLYLGRQDPIKRPWVFVETARLLPDVDFLMTGHNHFPGEGGWRARGLPPNLKFIGHVEGDQKSEVLTRSWMLMNPSIHEALPISFIEALGHGLPIVSSQDPDGVTSLFGRAVPNARGDGLDMAPHFARAIDELISADLTKVKADARQWAAERYTRMAFLTSLEAILAQKDGVR